MVTKAIENSYVQDIALAQEMEHRIALATVRIGDVTIRGIAVWRSRYFPSYRLGSGWDEVVSLPEELRTEIEADVISAYKQAKAAAKNNNSES